MSRVRARIAILTMLLPVAGAMRPAVGTASTETDPPDNPSAKVLVLVADEPITEGDLQFMLLSRGIAADADVETQRRLIEQLIDRRLVRQFLKDRKADPDPLRVDARVEHIKQLIRRRNENPEEVLDKFGFSETRLREEIALPLSWRRYFRRVVTDEEFRDFFHRHREEFDGSQVRASQIFRKAATDEERTRAVADLLAIRAEILAEKLAFADAARMHSRAPSAEDGGDIGFFPFEGRMPRSFSAAAFPLKDGEISQPFSTPFGVHLVTVTDRKPGQLSLEDVRPLVFRRMSQQRWDELAAELRKNVRIEWKVELDSADDEDDRN